MKDKLKTALKKDFNTLLAKEFTTDWREQRLVTGLQIDVMGIDNLEKAVAALLSSQLKEVRSRIEALQQEFVGKMAIDALIKLSLELEAELSQLAEVKEER